MTESNRALLDDSSTSPAVGAGGTLRKLGLVVLAVLILYRLVVLVALPTDALIRYSNDDTCYYLGIARNLARGEGPTFDGLNRTNGFHPLWQLILTLPFLAGAGTDLAWRLALALTVIVWGVGLWFLRRIVLRRWGEAAALLCLLLCLWPQIYGNATSGMEVTLTFTLVLILFDQVERKRVMGLEAPPGAELAAGALLALIFLSRLDTAFLHLAAGVYFIVAWWKGRERGRGLGDFLARGLRLFGPTALALIAYLLWNRLAFGSPMPISASLKSSFPVPVFNFWQFPIYRELGVFAILALVWTLSRRRDVGPAVGILAWGFAGQLLYLVLFLKWAPFAYYLIALGLPLALLAAADFQSRLLPEGRRLCRWALTLLALGVLGGQVVSWSRQAYGFQRASYEGALWARDNTPADTVLAMRDNGIFGYFCERPCINLDGLVNDYDYQRCLSQGRLGDYLRVMNVDYVVHHALPTDYLETLEEYTLSIPGRLYGSGADYTLHTRDVVFLSSPYRYGYTAGRMTLGIWRIEHPDPEAL